MGCQIKKKQESIYCSQEYRLFKKKCFYSNSHRRLSYMNIILFAFQSEY